MQPRDMLRPMPDVAWLRENGRPEVFNGQVLGTLKFMRCEGTVQPGNQSDFFGRLELRPHK
jgi:hypothetical protein